MYFKTAAYVSHDPLNTSAAETLFTAQGVEMVPLWLRDTPPDGEYWAVLYDLDYLPEQDCQQILDDLLSGCQTGRRGVHGHTLDEEHIEALEAKGIVAGRSLNPKLIRRLLNSKD